MVNPDVLVIGAGPGGYGAALRAAGLGRSVTVVEKGELGGVCLNVGCIPSKAVITAARLCDRIRNAARYGILTGEVSVDAGRLADFKDGIVRRLTGGVGTLFEKHGIRLLRGEAVFAGPGEVRVSTPGGEEILRPGSTIVATGSRPIEIPGFEVDEERILSSTGALALAGRPGRLLVIGGGYIGLELGIAHRLLGSEVTVVEVLDTLLPGVDPELSRIVARKMKKRGIRARLGTRALEVREEGDDLVVVVEGKRGREEVRCDRILVTVGRRPNSEGLGLDRAGVRTDDRGCIPVDEQCRTNVSAIHAVGDVAGPPLLAHKASHEGIVAAEAVAGLPSACDWTAVPAVIFTDPEIASVGLTEAEARAEGIEVVTGKFPFAASGRALTLDETEGFTKVVAEKGTGTVLGVHIVGPEAAELISEGALAVEMGASLEDLALTIHPHPTLPETLMEAAEAALGRAIHIYQGK